MVPESTEEARPEDVETSLPRDDGVQSREEVNFKSIKRGKAGGISRGFNKDDPAWKAAKAIMG